MKKKIVALVMCMVLLVAVSITGTLAYLTSSDAVTNTFTVGKISMTMDESKVDLSGVVQTKDGTVDKVKANDYKLLPGHTYTKDPTVHLAKESEACYIVIKVDNGLVNADNKNIEAAADNEYKTIDTQIANNGWTAVSSDINLSDADKAKYVGFYFKLVDVADAKNGQDYKVFEKFKVSGDVDGDTLVAFANATIDVKAFAIQSDGVDLATALSQAKDKFASMSSTSGSTTTGEE